MLGGLLAGTWANSVRGSTRTSRTNADFFQYLFMIELIMAQTYFTRFRQDPLWLKTIVRLTLTVDTISTVNHYACAYMFGGALATAVLVVEHSTFEERDRVRIPVTIWLVCSAVADVLLAGFLIYALQRYKSPFSRTNSMIKQLTTIAIQTGSSGSIVATIALAIYLNDPDGNISVGVGFTIGRVYAITMFHNLNSRAYLRSGPVTSAFDDFHLSTITTRHDSIDPSTHGIRVVRTVLVHTDDENSEQPVGQNDQSFNVWVNAVNLFLEGSKLMTTFAG
ncbi:hypothetical protein VNI00_009800 [Paramarasmius palmivorus]|uniref:DUF6534 domain-containing protein n=1 Tax=Paramarasmius palmivorus TaxID=297713 RepID=A0AAW0CQ94_9AGAR